MNTWYCEHDDGSLRYACCCEWFHEEKALDKPDTKDEGYLNAIESVDSDQPSLFCTAMCQPHGYELPLLREQYARDKKGIFGCNEWEIYSNESLRISPPGEDPEYLAAVINGSLMAEMSGDWGPTHIATALNTKVFMRFWDAVLTNGKAWSCDWIVKADPDTVWMPVRLRALLRTKTEPLSGPEPSAGWYLNNCHVGNHGPISVFSKTALGAYKG